MYCADTLEITDRPDTVLREVARVLRPGGAFVYDTVNRTLVSRLIYLGARGACRVPRPGGAVRAGRLGVQAA
ncbi:methyltransferase domain-containing protein [Streptomyces koelreuteriae]|uniref:Methyltransferase domain-containing protein n=1 Tax=Streptomyces koelreuteriae TaxID=2838015 RepID=A0ABX8FJ23_9ACTN|nr:methyltransferase domain-containing protein [Streptomyces koelreuteriae]